MVLDFILPILVNPINQYVVMPIRRRISYAFKCDSRVQALQAEVDRLKAKRISLQQSVENATRRAQDINPNVTEWLSTADRAIGQAEEIAQGKEVAKKKCVAGLCPNFKTRYQLSKNVELKTKEIQKLLNKQGLDRISFCTPSYFSQLPSWVSMLNQIMDALRDLNLNMIGVCGMRNTGETAIAKAVQTKALQEKLFETVIVIHISQTPELKRIQGEIADFIGLQFDAEEIPERASQLHKRLQNSRVLIILDNLWEKLDLVAVGIPFNVCKIMLTSRKMDLLSKEMGAQKLFPLEALEEAETLSLFMSVSEPNHNLHAIATEIANKCGGLLLLIQIVAGGLKNKESHVWKDTLYQLSTYDNEDLYDKVYRVIESSYTNLPDEEIKSFFLLCALFGQSNIQIQNLLTYCMGLGLFKHIQYLSTIEDARNRVLTLIDKLKANGLLLDGDMVGFVKIHDDVRATACDIASRRHHAFFGSDKFSSRDWPDDINCTKISLPFYNNISELPVGLDYPEAQLFLLFNNDISLEVPNSFFATMEQLKVVDFRGMRLVPFPSSIRLLKDLRTLCLHKCRLDKVAVLGELKQLELLSFVNSKIVELPTEIASLTQLKQLDLRDCSNLQVIPEGVLSKLCSLEELYMLNSFVRWDYQGNASLMELESLANLLTLEIEIVDPKMIPIGFKCFSRLRRYKISIGHGWDWNGQYERSRTLKLKVKAGVELLSRETEDLYLDGVRGIESIFYQGFPKLKHMHVENNFDIQYLISSSSQDSGNAFPVLESLYLKKLHSMEKICSDGLGMGSFGELRILKIINCDKMKSLFSFSSTKCLQQLQELEVELCQRMEAVVGEGIEDVHHNNEVIEFSQLCSLKLKNLPHLSGFCKLKDESEQMGLLFSTMVSFPNLASLEVNGCNCLKHIFSSSTEAVVGEGIVDVHHNNAVIEFTQLRSLKLTKLPHLIGICKLKEESRQEGQLFSNMQVSLPNLTSVEVNGCKNLKHIFTASTVKYIMQLKNLKIKDCELDEELIQSKKMEEIEEEDSTETIVFPKLDTLSLVNLKNLKNFSNCPSLEFPLPRELTIEGCYAMNKFVGKVSCSESEEEVTFSNMDVDRSLRDEELLEGFQLDANIERITIKYYIGKKFPSWMLTMKIPYGDNSFVLLNNLVDLKLEWCYNCEQLPCLGYLPHLKFIEMNHMGRVKRIDNEFYGIDYPGRSSICLRLFPALQSLSVAWMENLTEWSSPSDGKTIIAFPRLQNLSIQYCPKLTGFQLVRLQIKDSLRHRWSVATPSKHCLNP